jgi:hypothetical protein
MEVTQEKIADQMGLTGKYRVLHFTRDLLPHEIEQTRRYLRDSLHGDYSAGIGLPIARAQVEKNIIPLVGRNVLTRLLCGDVTYTGAINYGAFGSGSTAFNSTSTQLNAEVYRKLNVGLLADGNFAYADWYIASGDVANQTFNEFGVFIDGTASANTGQAISLLLPTGGFVKSGAMFISFTLTLS